MPSVLTSLVLKNINASDDDDDDGKMFKPDKKFYNFFKLFFVTFYIVVILRVLVYRKNSKGFKTTKAVKRKKRGVRLLMQKKIFFKSLLNVCTFRNIEIEINWYLCYYLKCALI